MIKKATVPFYEPRSIADIIMSERMPRWRRWLLCKLIPQLLWELPAQELMRLQKGAVIGHISIITGAAEGGATVDIGEAKP